MTKKRDLTDDELQKLSGAGAPVEVDTNLVRRVGETGSTSGSTTSPGDGDIMLNNDSEAESDAR